MEKERFVPTEGGDRTGTWRSIELVYYQCNWMYHNNPAPLLGLLEIDFFLGKYAINLFFLKPPQRTCRSFQAGEGGKIQAFSNAKGPWAEAN